MIIVWFYDAVPGECYIGKKISTYEDFCNASTPDERSNVNFVHKMQNPLIWVES